QVTPPEQPTLTKQLSSTSNQIDIIETPTKTGATPNVLISEDFPVSSGIIILSLLDGNYFHLFAYHPQTLPLTHITEGNWNDIDPQISPDGTRLAFSSQRNGFWDIYIMDLSTGNLINLTDTPEFDGSPTWSPDNQWLAYESYMEGNIEIKIISAVDLTQNPLRLTNDPAIDRSPSWSPLGRVIAFVSTRSGDEEIWLAHLDESDMRFKNISLNPNDNDRNPAWSPDGEFLAWSSDINGFAYILRSDLDSKERSVHNIGTGVRPLFSPDGTILLAEMQSPNQTALGGYSIETGNLVFPPDFVQSQIRGFDWETGIFTELVLGLVSSKSPFSETPLWQPEITLLPAPPSGRYRVVPLDEISAPLPYLHDAVDEAFQSLRLQTELEAGWNYLDSLENAYVPLTEPPSPNMEQDWLYTGRSFAANPLPLYASWLTIVKENINGQTYWRLYLKARYQDGSQGEPLRKQPWDISARYSGDPLTYELGGKAGQIPEGYWVDFTEIALRFGWKRLPALNNWRTYFSGARFNQFVMYGGLDWISAMSELYPPEALATTTRVPTYTLTSSPTPEKYTPATPTLSLTPSETPTVHPTWTSSP
ncbi:MAG: hypothetical protein MUO76_10025, partial [Anaerolineaceae bacterium]|nr:hypothetical protein [Anaerolineaceae bacterium]